MQQAEKRSQWRFWVAGMLVLTTVSAALLYYVREIWWDQACSFYTEVFKFFTDRDKVKSLVDSWGPWGPLLYILLQATQVVVAPIPGETTGGLVSGFLFGAALGTTYSLIGLTLGSTVGFLLGRWLELHVITRWVSQEVLDRFQFVMERQGALIALLLFALPYFPKDYLCIILGLSGMPLKVFLVVVLMGRTPATLLFNLQGAQLYGGNYSSFMILFAVFLVLAVVLYVMREPLYRWLTRLGEPEKPAGP